MQGSKFEIIYLSKVKTCFDDSNTARNYEDNSTEQAKYQLCLDILVVLFRPFGCLFRSFGCPV
jgi:hypothetical protein